MNSVVKISLHEIYTKIPPEKASIDDESKRGLSEIPIPMQTPNGYKIPNPEKHMISTFQESNLC